MGALGALRFPPTYSTRLAEASFAPGPVPGRKAPTSGLGGKLVTRLTGIGQYRLTAICWLVFAGTG